jgi:hypothetical protein
MRRLVLLVVVVLTGLLQIHPALAQSEVNSLTVANWKFDVRAAVKARYFMGPIHLGNLDDGRDWLVVALTATNTSGKEQELHSDAIQLRSDGEMIKQTGDESEAVAEELGAMSIGGPFPHDIEAGKTFDIVQVFKVSPNATNNTLVFDFSGEWEIPLDGLIAESAGDPQFLGGETESAVALSPWKVETASYRLELIGAAVASTFTGPFHLGKPEAGYDWLVVTYQLTNLKDEDTKVKADSHRLVVGTDELKQATDETKSVSAELGVAMLTLDLKPNESIDAVQVFKVPGSATAYTLQVFARGKLFVNLTPVVVLANGEGSAVVPGSSIDLAQVDMSGVDDLAAPPVVPTEMPSPTETQEPTELPAVDDQLANPTAAAGETVSSEVIPAAALSGRLGGPLSEIRTRFGEPSWTDEGLIGYNSVSLSGTDAILVVYFDENEVVSKISIVYLQRPALLDASSAIDSLVSDIGPLDGSCRTDGAIGASLGFDVSVCHSEALEEVVSQSYLEARGLGGEEGSYYFEVDPTADEYFEVVVQLGNLPVDAGMAMTQESSTDLAEKPTATTFEATTEELEYGAEILRQTRTMADSLARFAALTEDADATSFLSEEWLVAVAVELVIWQQTYQDALSLNPPPRFAAAHAKYLEGMGYISQSADAFAYGVDNFDVDSIEQAAVLMSLGNAAIQEATEEIRAVTG